MGACDTWNVEINILVYENEMFSWPAEFHFNNWLKVLVHFNIFDNDYRQGFGDLYTFVPNKVLGQLLNISPEKSKSSKTFNLEFSYIEV